MPDFVEQWKNGIYNKIERLISRGHLEEALVLIECLARMEYIYNQTFCDDTLEEYLGHVVRNIQTRYDISVSNSRNQKVLFYDGVGFNTRGLALIYTEASPENLKNYVGIDSGYIQYLWRFGIIGAVLLLTAQFLLFYIAWRSTKKRQAKCILATFPFMILTYLFKLYSWGNFGAAFICFSLPVVIIVDAQKQERRLALSLLGRQEWTIRK